MLKLTLSSLVASFFVADELPPTRRPFTASEEKCKRKNGKTMLTATFSVKTKVTGAVAAAARKRRDYCSHDHHQPSAHDGIV
ncbi:hypothetical protein VNO80_15702 [Phaseolus coccineus]|uniref:Secreted protein n=1 Tax=Phaseolus coccineus TaxID=3886 RepID=A0AAN9MKQ6_PHACN